jgi:hypothetical protein
MCFDRLGDLGSSYSLHVSAADHHFTTDGRRQGRKAHLDVNRRPPPGDCRPSDSCRCYRADGTYSRLGVDAGGASGTRAWATAFIAAGVLPWTLASQCRTCITCLTGNPSPLVTPNRPLVRLRSIHAAPCLDVGMLRASRILWYRL